MTSTPQAEPRRAVDCARLAREPKVVVGGGFILVLIVLAVFAPLIAPQDPLEQDLMLGDRCRRLGFAGAEPGYLARHRRSRPRRAVARSSIGARIALTVAFVAAGACRR